MREDKLQALVRAIETMAWAASIGTVGKYTRNDLAKALADALEDKQPSPGPAQCGAMLHIEGKGTRCALPQRADDLAHAGHDADGRLNVWGGTYRPVDEPPPNPAPSPSNAELLGHLRKWHEASLAAGRAIKHSQPRSAAIADACGYADACRQSLVDGCSLRWGGR